MSQTESVITFSSWWKTRDSCSLYDWRQAESLDSLCCRILIVFSISYSPLARVCGRRARCTSTFLPSLATVRRRESTSSRSDSRRFMRCWMSTNAFIQRSMGASTSDSTSLPAPLITRDISSAL